MSDAARQNLKVSREGIVLIKSFEGFRPRAIQRVEGGWIIGYGHTLSAREGATVSEADAELLLRYDLMPVEKTVNETVPADLNQHQFDALVSFAFSVGVDRFAGSDVRQRLNAGAPGEAADAIMGWPEPTPPETALRRRAAERALFVANPDAPVALSDLLSAPLPPPSVVSPPIDAASNRDLPVEEPRVETETVEPTLAADAAPAEEPPIQIEADLAPASLATEVPDTVDPRGAAVAALLGEPTDRLVQDQPPAETTAGIEPLSPSNDNPPLDAEEVEDSDAGPASEPEPSEADTEVEPATLAPTVFENAAEQPVREEADPEVMAEGPSLEGAATEAPTTEEPTHGAASVEEPGFEEPVDEGNASSSAAARPAADPATAWLASRYAPYGMAMIGPLPFLSPAAPRAEPVPAEPPVADGAEAEAAVIPAEAPTETGPASEPEPEAEPVAALAPVETPLLTPTFVQPAIEPAAPEPALSEDVVVESEPTATVVGSPSVEPMTYAPPVDPAPLAELVLTPPEEAPEPAFARPLWTAEERDAPDGSETNLFGEDLTLTLGGSVMRHEIETDAPARFDWKETAPFIFMGGVGLVSFGASMAAFRRAAEQSGGSELTIIGWVLALIGLGCVGVSSINLYRRFGLPGGD